VQKVLPSAKDANDATNLIVASDNGVDLPSSVKAVRSTAYLLTRERIEACSAERLLLPRNCSIAVTSAASVRPASFSTRSRGGFDERREDVVLGDIRVVHRLLQTLRVAQQVKRLARQRDVIWWSGLGRETNDDALQCAFDECLTGGLVWSRSSAEIGMPSPPRLQLLNHRREDGYLSLRDASRSCFITGPFVQEYETDVCGVYCMYKGGNERPGLPRSADK